ncbi:MAG: alpha/beta hydrolase [Acidimicrobiia bacterium]|nr:alpha/beta hydrolase [Acidimicrobiia bacterium]
MAVHHQVATLLEGLAALRLPDLEDSTPEEARAIRAALLRPSPEPIGEVADIEAGGVPARLYRPVTSRSAGLLVYLHGGGWVLGDVDSHDDVCRALANRGGCLVLSVDYRLAPEDPFPAAVDDAVTATRWASEHAAELGADPERLAIGGDSAGGNLAAIVANAAIVPLCYQLLVYPSTDVRMTHPSVAENADGYFLTAAGMRWFFDHYIGRHLAGGGSPEDPRISPLCADDAALAAGPPAMVITAEYDPLRDEGAAYARRLADVGVPTSHVHFEGQIHGFFSMFELLDDARSAHALAAEALHTAFSR